MHGSLCAKTGYLKCLGRSGHWSGSGAWIGWGTRLVYKGEHCGMQRTSVGKSQAMKDGTFGERENLQSA